MEIKNQGMSDRGAKFWMYTWAVIAIIMILVFAWQEFDLTTVIFGTVGEDDFCSYNDCTQLNNTKLI